MAGRYAYSFQKTIWRQLISINFSVLIFIVIILFNIKNVSLRLEIEILWHR